MKDVSQVFDFDNWEKGGAMIWGERKSRFGREKMVISVPNILILGDL